MEKYATVLTDAIIHLVLLIDVVLKSSTSKDPNIEFNEVEVSENSIH